VLFRSYDGKGQVLLDGTNAKDLKTALNNLAPAECILEGFVPFEREISLIAARGKSGDMACYSAAENIHRDGILRTSTVPAAISAKVEDRAVLIGEKILSELDYVGVMGIEFFVTINGDLLVNEFAPRVHNSGHWTEAACVVSQFDQHVRAISGLPLGDPARHSNCVMTNLIGNDVSQVPEFLMESNALINLYGKSETRSGRKMGHVTRISPK